MQIHYPPDTAESLIRRFGLTPHPEGGHYRETYRSELVVDRRALPAGFSGDRPVGTAILFLLREGERSKLHRLRSDEIWHFYLGGPLTLARVSPDGEADSLTLGLSFEEGNVVQAVVPAGVWMGAYPEPGSGFCLVGCTVAPGFDFADFELGNRGELVTRFPHLRDLIERLTD
jgi:predicted cupin superfamily sugar epimerase